VGSSWYQTVKLKVEEIREIGFTDIWLPPPSQSVAREGYLPTKLYVDLISFSFPGFLLVALSEYAQSLASYWSHVRNIFDATTSCVKYRSVWLIEPLNKKPIRLLKFLA
jgi:hypothetical protein